MQLNFSISELCKTSHNVNNNPTIKEVDNLLNLIFYCLQPLRDKLQKPILITSGYRSEALNKIVGGKYNSQHLKGQACDFKVNGMTINQIIDFIRKNNIEYDQLINEYDKWVHISYAKGRNRKQVLKIS